MAFGKIKSSVGLLVLVTLLGGTRSAGAGLITWEFAGEISTVSDPDNQLAGVIVVGSPFSVSFTYESTTPDRFPNALDNGSYLGAIKALRGQVGGISISNPEGVFGNFRISDNPPLGGLEFDSFAIETVIDEILSPVDFFSMRLSAGDLTGTIFPDDSLPLFPPALNRLDETAFILQTPGAALWVRGELTSITPEPTSLVLFALTGVLACRRKRRKTI